MSGAGGAGISSELTNRGISVTMTTTADAIADPSTSRATSAQLSGVASGGKQHCGARIANRPKPVHALAHCRSSTPNLLCRNMIRLTTRRETWCGAVISAGQAFFWGCAARNQGFGWSIPDVSTTRTLAPGIPLNCPELHVWRRTTLSAYLLYGGDLRLIRGQIRPFCPDSLC